MSRQESNLKSDDILVNYWSAVKLAVAVACIRSKPLHLTTKQYVLELHFKYWENHLKLSKKELCNRFQQDSVCSAKLFIPTTYFKKKLVVFDVLSKYIIEFESLSPFMNNCNHELLASFEYKRLEEKVLLVCVSLMRSIGDLVCNSSQLLEMNALTLLNQATAAICKGVKFLETAGSFKSFFTDVYQKSLCTAVNDAIDLISILCQNLMESFNYELKKVCFILLQEFAKCQPLKVVLCKQLLYWLCFVKQKLIQTSSGEIILDDKIVVCLNNISFVFKLFECVLLPLFVKVDSKTSCTRHSNKESLLQVMSLDFKERASEDWNFFFYAKKQLEENVQLCSPHYPLFTNYILHIGFILSKLLVHV